MTSNKGQPPGDTRPDALSLLPEEWEALLTEWGQPRYRAAQIFRWLHRPVESFADMTDLPAALRGVLTERCALAVPKEMERLTSADSTRKILWALADGQRVESALMQYDAGLSICLSTQAGCRQGCAFCASCTGGLKRNLTAGEILAQILYCREDVSRVVLMGIGEPLDNFSETVRFLRLLSHPGGRNLSLRHVSLSTCGPVPEMDALGDLGFPVTLSVSLHAPDDATRRRIMPIAKRYPVAEVAAAAVRFFTRTGRRVSYEYIMIDGLNDTDTHARRLANLLRGHPAHINLIPCNPIEGKPYRPSPPQRIAAFAKRLQGYHVTVRRTLGSDINAACGQLRNR